MCLMLDCAYPHKLSRNVLHQYLQECFVIFIHSGLFHLHTSVFVTLYNSYSKPQYSLNETHQKTS